MEVNRERAPSTSTRKAQLSRKSEDSVVILLLMPARHKSRLDLRFPNLYEGPLWPGRYEGQPESVGVSRLRVSSQQRCSLQTV